MYTDLYDTQMYHFKKYEVNLSKSSHEDRKEKVGAEWDLGGWEINFWKGNRRSKGQVVQKQIQEKSEAATMAKWEGWARGGWETRLERKGIQIMEEFVSLPSLSI